MDRKHPSARLARLWSPVVWRRAQPAETAEAPGIESARSGRAKRRHLLDPGLLGRVRSRTDIALRWFAGLPRPLAIALMLGAVLESMLVGGLAYNGVTHAYAVSFNRYQDDLAVARDATGHLQVAETDLQELLKKNPLDTARITQAHDEMVAAHADFVRLNVDLATIPDIATLVPRYGPLLAAGQHLLPIALDATRAGMLGLTDWGIVANRLHDPLDPNGSGLTAEDLTTLQHDAPLLVADLDDALAHVQTLSPSDVQIDPRLGPAIESLRANLPAIQSAMRAYATVITLAPALLGVGTPANYLVEILDSTELRPGGGFIGNIGILTLSGGRMRALGVQDVDLLDGPYRAGGGSHYIPLPAHYTWFTADNRWGLRDSNLDADFPTSARNGEQLYAREGGKTQLQGVITITPWVFENLLKITGPIYVPEFKGTVTAANVIDEIHYHQLTSSGADSGQGGDNGSSFRKRFTADLFQHFLEHVKAQASGNLGQLARVLIAGVHTKDVQIYLNSTPAEQVLAQRSLASSIEAPTSGDSLFVVESNDAAIKANNWLSYHYSDAVTLDTTGTATHRLTLAVSWPANPASLTLSYPSGRPGLYSSYLRVYVPPQAQLLQQSGWAIHPTTAAFDREVWGGTISLTYGKTTTVALTWEVPEAASRDDAGWHYSELVQKQAGITYPLSVSVTLPTCANVSAPPASFTVSGHTIGATLPLAGDTATTISYTLSGGACR